MDFEKLFEKLDQNPREKSLEAVRLLLKISENILKDPSNPKIRTLNKSNQNISQKILQVNGGTFCLEGMGFRENSTSYVLPMECDVSDVLIGKDLLLMWKDSVESSLKPCDKINDKQVHKPSYSQAKEIIKPIVLPPLKLLYKHPFLNHIEKMFHSCLRYANKDVQDRARKLIPLSELETSAQRRLRTIQEHAKKNKLAEPNVSMQDLLILELLQWFKENFFTWVNSPECENCGNESKFYQMSSDRALLVYTDTVELHKCLTCSYLTPFPRYNDLNILLETRRGRCGEWANTFTLLCKSMNWDARFVMDENDHVWTEVYSAAQKRWLHCDPCENICDKPLIYETGWKKQISYVIAYSDEEVQDVTWRYSSNHKDVLNRRTKCDENILIEALIKLRSLRQQGMSEARRVYLTNRVILELAEMMIERKPGEDESSGRQSGDTLWKLARGEIHASTSSQFIWKIIPTFKKVIVRYSPSGDFYQLINGEEITKLDKWYEGCNEQKNIQRKEERDWKQVYLARGDNSNAHISWQFELPCSLDKITVQFQQATFENGAITVKMSSDDTSVIIPQGFLETSDFSGKTKIKLEASLSGGKGDVAWQHTQLFRQPLGSDEFPFCVVFTFK